MSPSSVGAIPLSLAALSSLLQVTRAQERAHTSWQPLSLNCNSCYHCVGVYGKLPDRLQRVLQHIKGKGLSPFPNSIKPRYSIGNSAFRRSPEGRKTKEYLGSRSIGCLSLGWVTGNNTAAVNPCIKLWRVLTNSSMSISAEAWHAHPACLQPTSLVWELVWPEGLPNLWQ